MQIEADIDTIHEAAVEFAREAGKNTVNYFGTSFDVDYKDDDSPVTIADRDTERLLRKRITEAFPGHGILGEEFERTNRDSAVQWILDPIDGTRTFIHGVPLYTTLIGVMIENKPTVGVIYAPVLDEMCDAALGKGTRLNGAVVTVRECGNLGNATLLTENVTNSAKFGYGEEFEELLSRTNIHRTWGDAYGHMLVATGRADIMFDPVLAVWDAAPLIPVLREAGGIFCDTNGVETIESGNGFSCSKELREQVLEIFRRKH